MLLEDLGDVSLWDRVREAPEAEALRWYRKAIDELLGLQVAGTRARDDDCMAFGQAFDRRLYLWELDHFIEYGLEQGRPGSLPRAERQVLDEAFRDMAERLDGLPRVLSHRDYHSWNLMVHDGAVAVIDFQDALLAPRAYDLASLLNDRETDRVVTPGMEVPDKNQLQDEAATERGGSHPGGDQAFSAAAITEREPTGPIPAEKKMALVVRGRGLGFSTSKRSSRGRGSKV